MTHATASKILVLLILLPIGIKSWQTLQKVVPPEAVTPEAHTGQTDVAAPIDHSAFDVLLRQYAGDDGVDYTGLKPHEGALAAYLSTLADIDPSKHSRNELLALYINAYNAATLKLVLEYTPGLKTIKDIPAAKRWEHSRWRIAREQLSLNDIEHKVLRARFSEPRIHFAIVCASVGCPPLRNEAFRGDRIEEQLEDQARSFHRLPQNFRWDQAERTLYLSSIYQWFPEDFQTAGRTLAGYAAQYAMPPLDPKLTARGAKIKVKFLDYDWSLNHK